MNRKIALDFLFVCMFKKIPLTEKLNRFYTESQKGIKPYLKKKILFFKQIYFIINYLYCENLTKVHTSLINII